MRHAAQLEEGGSLVDLAVRRVRDHIRESDLKVGDTLPGEGQFAAELGVSRAVMREAFGALAALRLIDVGNGRRARVGAIDGSVMGTSLDHAVATAQISVAEVWDVRRTLELRTAYLAARHRSDADAHLILAAAKKYGKTCSMLVASQAQAKQWKEAGALLLVYLSDAEMLHAGFTQAMAQIRG